MGFRTGAYAKIWGVTPLSDTSTKLQLSISRKDKRTGEYVTDFSGFVMCVGTAAASKAVGLTDSSRIKLGDCDVSTVYKKDGDKKTVYTNFKLFSFEEVENNSDQSNTEPEHDVDGGDIDDSNLPF